MSDFIYNQRHIPKDKWRYGLRASAATGCGWVATYNALRLLDVEADPEDLIRYYERHFPVINGNFGTFITEPAVYFRKKGFEVKTASLLSKFDETAKQSDACVMFFFWRRGIKIGAHYVALRYDDGKFIGYNTFSNSTGPDNYGDSLEKFLKRRKYFGAFLIGINKRERT